MCSTDGAVHPEGQHFLRSLAARLATKWKMPYARVMNFVRTRLSIAILRATGHCVHGERRKFFSLSTDGSLAVVLFRKFSSPALFGQSTISRYLWLSVSFLHTDMHSPLDSIPHIFGRMHAPVHRRTCFQHKCTHTRSHAPSIPQQTFCCFLRLSLLAASSCVNFLIRYYRYHLSRPASGKIEMYYLSDLFQKEV